MDEKIFAINFDPSQFIQNVNAAVDSMEGMEQNSEELAAKIMLLQKTVNSVSFQTPVQGLMDLKEVMRSLPKENELLKYFKDTDAAIDEIVKDADKLTDFLSRLKKELATVDDKETFTQLSKTIAIVENQLKSLTGETVKYAESTKSAKTRLKEMKAEMIKLEDAGLETSVMYKKLQKDAARLTDQLGDQAEAVRVLASDTFALDATVDTLQNVAAGWQVVEGVMALAGNNNEELQKSMQRLMAVMNIANGLQQINAFLTGQSAGKLALLKFWTDAQALSQRALSAAFGASAAAAKGLSAAITGLGLGAAVAGITFLITKLQDIQEEGEKARDKQAQNQAASAEAIGKAAADELENIKRTATNAEARAKSLNKSEEVIQNIREAAYDNSQAFIQQTLNDLRVYIVELARLKGVESEEYKKAVEQSENLLALQTKLQNDYVQSAIDAETKANEKKNELRKKALEDQKKADEEQRKLLVQYSQKLRELELKLYEERTKDLPVSEKLIRERYDKEYKIEAAANAETFKKLGKEKVRQLNDITKQVYTAQSEAEVKQLQVAQAATATEISRLIEQRQNEIARLNIELTRDNYEKQAQTINQSEKEAIQGVNNTLEDALKDQADKRKAGLISAEQYYNNLLDLEELSAAQIILIQKKALLEREQLSKDYYATQIQNLQAYIELANSEDNLDQSKLIAAQAKLYAEGKITFEAYQKQVERIQKDSKRTQLQTEIDAGRERLALLEAQLAAETDAIKRAQIQTAINTTTTAINTAQSTKDTLDKRLVGFDSLISTIFGVEDAKDVEAIQRSLQSIVNTTTQALRDQAEAEVRSVDAAIASQKKRVDEALKIAQAGNAEYLQLEEDRLKALEVRREQAARKQLAIDSALQASQILVAVAGAAAQIAKGGPVNVIAGIASIVAALAASAGLIRSIQNQQPKFFAGTDEVRTDVSRGTDRLHRGKHRSGKDKIPAWLHEGEAVIQADKNARYAPTVQAIRRGILPPDILNNFVRRYSTNMNYAGIASATKQAQVSMNMDTRAMEKRLNNLENLNRQMLEALTGLNVNVRMDEGGFAASINTYLNRKNKILNA
jgi:hypothetical protein